jgi:hypothetical protein
MSTANPDQQPANEPSSGNMTDPQEEGVVIPEEFQQKVHGLLKGANKHHLNHVRDRVYAREDELRKEAEAKTSKNKGAKSKYPEVMSTEGMPSN